VFIAALHVLPPPALACCVVTPGLAVVVILAQRLELAFPESPQIALMIDDVIGYRRWLDTALCAAQEAQRLDLQLPKRAATPSPGPVKARRRREGVQLWRALGDQARRALGHGYTHKS
jgi:hypothetical protein